jgi:peroxiredoxin family protein
MSDPMAASAMRGVTPPVRRLCIICTSGQWDRLYAAFVLANGALSLGQSVDLFFAFWGAAAMQSGRGARRRGALGRVLGWFLPRSVGCSRLSQMHLFGLGRRLMTFLMRREGIDDLPVLIANAEELGATFHYCDTSLRLLGIELPDPSSPHGKIAGVTTFLATARDAQIIFI